MVSNNFKKIIFKKLYQDLSGVEIIPYKDSIWFIDRNEKYWYFEYQKSGGLTWRYKFFANFFCLFSMKQSEFQWVISEWVEEVLNCRITAPRNASCRSKEPVEEVLNCRVTAPVNNAFGLSSKVEEVLNYKVTGPCMPRHGSPKKVEEVLNCKVTTPHCMRWVGIAEVEEVLNCKVTTPKGKLLNRILLVEEVINQL